MGYRFVRMIGSGLAEVTTPQGRTIRVPVPSGSNFKANQIVQPEFNTCCQPTGLVLPGVGSGGLKPFKDVLQPRRISQTVINNKGLLRCLLGGLVPDWREPSFWDNKSVIVILGTDPHSYSPRLTQGEVNSYLEARSILIDPSRWDEVDTVPSHFFYPTVRQQKQVFYATAYTSDLDLRPNDELHSGVRAGYLKQGNTYYMVEMGTRDYQFLAREVSTPPKEILDNYFVKILDPSQNLEDAVQEVITRPLNTTDIYSLYLNYGYGGGFGSGYANAGGVTDYRFDFSHQFGDLNVLIHYFRRNPNHPPVRLHFATYGVTPAYSTVAGDLRPDGSYAITANFRPQLNLNLLPDLLIDPINRLNWYTFTVSGKGIESPLWSVNLDFSSRWENIVYDELNVDGGAFSGRVINPNWQKIIDICNSQTYRS